MKIDEFNNNLEKVRANILAVSKSYDESVAKIKKKYKQTCKSVGEIDYGLLVSFIFSLVLIKFFNSL